jgi:hypothetical protein
MGFKQKRSSVRLGGQGWGTRQLGWFDNVWFQQGARGNSE